MSTGFNGWFLKLPEGRQAVLREDKWMLAENAYRAGKRDSKLLAALQMCAEAYAAGPDPVAVRGAMDGVIDYVREALDEAEKEAREDGE